MQESTRTLRQSLEGSYLQGYRISSLLLGLFFLILIPLRLGWMHAGPSHPILSGEAILFSLLCLLIAVFAAQLRTVIGHVENLGLVLVGFGLINNATLLLLTHDPDQAANFMLLLVVSGFTFLTRWRFFFITVVSFLFWAIGTRALIGSNPFFSWLFPMIAAAMLGLAMHLFTRRVLKALVVLRNHDQIILRQRARLIAELRIAMENMKILRGLIPICAQCKKVRNDGGYWQQVESYLLEHSEAKFTHGLCPGCSTTLTSEFEEILPPKEGEP